MNVAREDLSGTRIADGKYVLEKLLGEGGGGQVYLGEQTALGKQVAIKLLGAEYSRNEELVRRFLREARAAARVAHENVVEIFDFGSTGTGTAYIAMEFLEGESLAEFVDREAPVPWRRAKAIILQVCRALHVAHGCGVVHRDMKPENCFRYRRRSNEDMIKILDFGLAKVFGDERQPQLSLSTTGKVFGTPEYMSPEQARGQQADDRSDVYAVGIILYELLTGRVPFSDENSYLNVLVMHTTDPPVPPSVAAPNARIWPALDAVVLKALEKEPGERHQSMRDFAEAILALEEPGQSSLTGVPAVEAQRWIDQPNAKLVLFLTGLCVLLAGMLSWALVGR